MITKIHYNRYIGEVWMLIIFFVYIFIYGVGDIPIIATVCAAAYQEPAAIVAPCEDANNPPAIGPAADNPTKPKMKGEPIVTPNTIIGAQITADKNPILIYIYYLFKLFV
jgi:hypothetical protein